MTAKTIRHSFEARAGLMRGLTTLANAVAVTLGPRGRNVLIDRPIGAPRVTKDGVTVAQSIELPDKFENMGAQLLKEVASKTMTNTGDGTTTSTVLAYAIARQALPLIAAGCNPMDLKRGVDLAITHAVEYIKAAADPVEDHRDIVRVATVAANGDAEIGHLISEAMRAVGKDGVISIEEARGLETELDLTDGYRFDRGFISPHFVTDPKKFVVEMKGAFVLIYDGALTVIKPIVELLEQARRLGRPLLVIADSVEDTALATLVVNKMKGNMQLAAVRSPAYGTRRREMLEDIATLTGGEIIGGPYGVNPEFAGPESLGRAGEIRIERDATIIVKGDGDAAGRVAQLRGKLATLETGLQTERLQERISKLTGGIAVLRLGGASEVELKERKDRLDDALHAARSAVEAGTVTGGGVALLRAIKSLPADVENEDQRAGVDIVRRALRAPASQIISNAGYDAAPIVNAIMEHRAQDASIYDFGFDARTGDFHKNMRLAGIIDSAKVVRCALEDAGSIASLLITTEATIASSGG